MTSEMTLRPASEPPLFTDEQRQMIRDTFANGSSDEEFAVLMEIARARRLNPLLRQVHFVARWDATKRREVWAVQVSIDGLRAIAERTGLYAGQDEPEFGDAPDGSLLLCKVRVYRKDWPRPAVGVAYWDEYVQTRTDKQSGKTVVTAMWKKMPHVMLAKVAEALAIRKAFPEDAAGLYTGDEMAQASNDAPADDGARERQQEPRREEPKALPEGPRVVATVRSETARVASQAGSLSAAPAVHHDVSGDNPTLGEHNQAVREVEALVSTKRPEVQAMPPGAEHLAAAAAIEAEDAGSTLPPLDRFTARLTDMKLPGDGVALWLAHRRHLEGLEVAIRTEAWKSLCKQVETVGKMRNAGAWLKKAISVAEELGVQQPEPDPDGPRGGRKARPNGSAANSQGGAAEGSAGDGPQALAALVTRLASKLHVVGASEKQRTAELATVANSYLNRRDELVALGRGDEALDAVRAELLSRGCGDADALLAGVAKKRGIAA